MASNKALASTILLLSLNLLFFSMVSSTIVPTCPIDILKLGVCADILNLLPILIGSPPYLPCCSLIQGLADLEAAVCLCTAIKADILGINLNLPIALSLVLNNCGKGVPSGFECPN